MDLRIPAFATPGTPRINPHAYLARKHLKEWSRQTGIVRDGPGGENFDGALLDRLAAWTYPYADHETILLMADWMGWFFAFDDVLDDTPEGRDQDYVALVAASINSVYTDVRRSAPDAVIEPYRIAMQDLWERTTAGMPAPWCRRLATDLEEYLNSHHTQALVNKYRICLPEGFYRVHRRAASAIYVALDIGEAASRRPVPDTLLVHPYVQVARQAANNVVSWVNDLYSAPKELGLDDLCNYVNVLRHQDGWTAQEAAQRVGVEVTGQTEAFLQAEHLIRTDLMPHVSAYEQLALEGMLATMACGMNGTPAWCAESARYRTRLLPGSTSAATP